MRIVTTIITCSGRSEMLAATLLNLRQTELRPPIVCMDASKAERPQQRQVENAERALCAALASDPELILFLEDDLEFNPHLYHNLLHWRPRVEGWFGLASLYNPNIRELERFEADHCFIADPESVYGSQAFLLTPECAAYCLNHWLDVPGMQDIKLSRLARNGGYKIFYHTPSLVQHVGRESTFGGNFHYTRDYDPAFKA